MIGGHGVEPIPLPRRGFHAERLDEEREVMRPDAVDLLRARTTDYCGGVLGNSSSSSITSWPRRTVNLATSPQSRFKWRYDCN